MWVSYYLTAWYIPQWQLHLCSETKPFLSLQMVWLTRLTAPRLCERCRSFVSSRPIWAPDTKPTPSWVPFVSMEWDLEMSLAPVDVVQFVLKLPATLWHSIEWQKAMTCNVVASLNGTSMPAFMHYCTCSVTRNATQNTRLASITQHWFVSSPRVYNWP